MHEYINNKKLINNNDSWEINRMTTKIRIMEEYNMMKKNLAKAVMLGLFMATLSTGSAYATLAETTPASAGVTSEQSAALTERQAEIDKLLFEDKAGEIEKLGFMVNYTGVVEDYVEIGISPFSDENANFIYDLVGKDGVKVIEFDQSIIYASGAAPDVVTEEAPAVDEQAAADDEEVQIQIESTTGTTDDAVPTEEKVYKDTSAEDGVIKTVSASEETAEDKGLSTPIIVLAVVGGAALVGGAVLLSKKKASK
ncbi:MAG: hypothetical protein K0R46_1513 [Herbinix sp.]|jgi:hypothetical protein|nr:hypothetical protein [Herbinix sp.]